MDNVSFSVEKGYIFGLLGPNGSGKTSIMKMILGLLSPTSGDIYVYGKLNNRANHKKILSITGALLEGKRSLYWPLTVKENLEYFGRIKMMSTNKIKKRINELVELMGLEKYYNYRVEKLSTGYQQRVSLASAIIHEPKLLLLDEPTLGLDVESSLILRKIIKEFVADGKSTVFLTTHDMHLAHNLCHQFLILRDGKINSLFDRSLFNNYSNSFIYIFELDHIDSKLLMGNTLIDEKNDGILDYRILEDNKLKIILKYPELLVNVISTLESKGYRIKDIRSEQLTLEEVFLNLKFYTEKGDKFGEKSNSAYVG